MCVCGLDIWGFFHTWKKKIKRCQSSMLPQPRRFSFDVPFCACGKPFGVPCDAAVPDDYFSDVAFPTARFASRRAIREPTDASVETELVDGGDSVEFFIVDERFPDRIAVSLEGVRVEEVDVRVSLRCEPSWPHALSADQIAALDMRDDRGWREFLDTLPPANCSLDVIARRAGTGGVLARVFLPLSRDADLLRVRASASESVQVNANGRVVLLKEATPPIEAGTCSWTSASRPVGRVVVKCLLREWATN